MDRIGRYEIIAELGRGAMGIVYKARDTKIGREVAIKTIRLIDQAAPSETASLKERLFREAQSAGRLSHPGIVTIYDIAEEAGLAYITMEFVEGRTLESMMRSGAAGDPEFIADFLHQTAAALDYAHGKDIVHRDIKPANMMITPEGGVKITDFGIARIASSQLTQTGTVMGTPSYMSPEQVRGDAVDGRSDQFSLGVISYELLTGQKPFAGESLTSVIFRIVSSEPARPRDLRPDISEKLEQAVLTAMAKDPAARFATCRDLAKAVENSCGGLRAANASVGASEPSDADLTAPAFPATPSRGEAEQYDKTMPITAAGGTAKLPPLASKAGNGGVAQVRRTVGDTTVEKRRKRSSALGWVMTLLLLLAGGGAAAWWLLLPVPQLGTSEVAGHFPSPDPAAGLFAEQVRKLQEDGTVMPLPVTVTFDSNPPGSQVVVDGGQEAAACVTPCSLELLPGQHQALASLPDYLDESIGFEVGTEPTDLRFDLRPVPPTRVQFTSQPRGTRVVVDGNRDLSCTAPCSLDLRRGPHKVVASAANYHSAEESFEVDAEPMEIALELSTLPPVVVRFAGDPAGSRVIVDGRPQWACTVPCELKLPRGRHEYLASQSGFRSVRRTLEVGGDPLAIRLDLERIVGSLLISSQPTGADVFVNGQKHPEPTSTRLSLAPGYHLIRVQSGDRISERSVAMQEGEFRTMHFVLGAGGALRSSLVVRSNPPGANIVLNDSNQAGRTPREITLPVGAYRVTLSLPGYRPVIRELELVPNQPTTLDIALSPQ